jgi:spore photoproduct lyase
MAKPWIPKRVLVTRSAREWAHGREVAARAAALGCEVTELTTDRVLTGDFTYAEAKSTLAVTVAPSSKRKLQPIPPSADWRVDLAEGCPAHCAYCYLAGSLKGAPITRVYANLPEILAELPRHLGGGTITSRSEARAHEGTTFEASCYTDPLGIEPLTGSLQALIGYFGEWEAEAQLRFTTKFADVEPLLGLKHGGRVRMRASVNPPAYARFEGGTDRVADRLRALRQMADAGYLVGLTVAPIIAAPGWEQAYDGLITDIGAAFAGSKADLTMELITHRFTPGSKLVLESWYPGSKLDMGAVGRTEKRTKFGTVKHVYDRETMKRLRTFFEERIAARLPHARVLYWT